MTEIRPWLEAGDAPAHLRDLLREAEVSKPLDERTQARSKRRLIAMSALPAAAGVMFWVKSVALGAVLGGAVVVVAYAPRFQPTATEPQATAAQSVSRTPMLRHSGVATRDAGVDHDAGGAAAVVLSAAPPTRTSVATLPLAEPSQLSRETQLLERAREVIGHDARRALASLDTHRREFPHGALELERELMTVDALLRLGQRPQARLRAAQLRAQAPGSIYEQRLTRLLGEDTERQP